MVSQDISLYRKKLEKRKAEEGVLRKQHRDTKRKRMAADQNLIDAEKSRDFIRHVAQETQKQLEAQISNVGKTALAAVFDNPDGFEVSFESRRNKTECDIWFVKNGKNRLKPVDSSGFGACDIASFALRATVIELQDTRKIAILDEPFKNLSRDLQPRAAEMLRMLIDKLGLQVIMTTHIEQLIEGGDRIFEIENGKIIGG